MKGKSNMYILIINPIAGNGRAKQAYKTILKSGQLNQFSYYTFYTKYEGHAEKITQQFFTNNNLADICGIIVFGGDGTIHEVINGMGDVHVPISFIPGGSGNDFARGISLKTKPIKIINNIITNNKKATFSLGQYHLYKGVNRKFVNCIGFGFDAVVAKSANESKLKNLLNKIRLGKISYLLALIKQLFFYKPIHITAEIDGIPKTFSSCLLMTINNQPYFGGGMKINPLAKNNNKHFSVLVIDSIPKWKVLLLFGTVYTGKHIHFREVHTFKAHHVKVKAKEKIPFQVDGETGMTHFCQIKKHNNPIHVFGVS